MEEKEKKKKRPVLIVIIVLLALVLMITIGGVIYVNHILNKINHVVRGESAYMSQAEVDRWEAENQEDNSSGLPEVQESDVDLSEATGTLLGDEDGLVNIMLVGIDRREGEGRTRSDTMILCTFDTKRKMLTTTSFLRDLYVQIPGYRDNRLNAAYAIGGMDLLYDSIEKNFGIKVHGTLEVDFWQITDVINALNGVDVKLTEAEVTYLNRANKWSLVEGMNHLDGEQALAYARIRRLDSDFGRTNRQRTVMSAIVNQYKSLSLSEMLTMLDVLLPMVTTDMTNTEMIRYVTGLLPVVQDGTLHTQYIPGEEDFRYAYVRGMSVLLPDMEGCRAQLRESLYGETQR